MRLTQLRLEQFRNYLDLYLELDRGITIFLGRNGQGKTNLVEAVNFPVKLGSHRSPRDEALIRAHHDYAIIRLEVLVQDRTLGVDYQINRRGSNRVQLNRKATRPSEISRFYRAVLFAPEDLSIVRGEPSFRRGFIDELLVQLHPRYSEILAEYDRNLKQRNALLKSARAQQLRQVPETLSIWSEKLVELGSQIIQGRNQVVQTLQPLVSAKYQYLVENDHQPEIAIHTSITPEVGDSLPKLLPEIQEMFHGKLLTQERAELERGVTLVGPHRDDLYFGLNDLPVRGYASHGESWSFALSLRLSEAELLRQGSDSGDPIILLDDVFAELDKYRREKLASALVDYEQVIITAAVSEDIPHNLNGRTVTIAAGKVVSDGTGAHQ